MIYDQNAPIPLIADKSHYNPDFHATLAKLDQRAAQNLLGRPVFAYVSDSEDYPFYTADTGGYLTLWQAHQRNGRTWSPSWNVADAMSLLYKLGQKEYMKWRISDSYYHGKTVCISPPCEGMSGYEPGMREASSWCAGDDELAEHITRACLYAMGEDVEIDDIYGFAKGFHALPVSARRDLLGQSKAHEDKELLDFLRARHPDWLRGPRSQALRGGVQP